MKTYKKKLIGYAQKLFHLRITLQQEQMRSGVELSLSELEKALNQPINELVKDFKQICVALEKIYNSTKVITKTIGTIHDEPDRNTADIRRSPPANSQRFFGNVTATNGAETEVFDRVAPGAQATTIIQNLTADGKGSKASSILEVGYGSK